MNYTLQEYANDVVYHLQTVCDEAQVPHPTIVSESGRAVAAYHSVLVFNVLESRVSARRSFGGRELPDSEQPFIDLKETYDGLTQELAWRATTMPSWRWTRP